MFDSGAEGLGFNPWVGQIQHKVANGSPPLQLFFERSCVAQAQCRGDGLSKFFPHFPVKQEYNKNLIFETTPIV